MAALNFPTSPTFGDIYTANGYSWQWNGTAWISYNQITALNNVTIGLTTPAAGTFTALTATTSLTLPSQSANNFLAAPSGSAGAPSFRGINFADMETAFGGSNTSLAYSGYQKFPNGLIIQWGYASASTAGNTNTFPITFPTLCFRVVVSATASGTSMTASRIIGSNTFTTSNFKSYTVDVAGSDGHYVAFGY